MKRLVNLTYSLCLLLCISTNAKPPIIDISKLKELDVEWELLSELEIREFNERKNIQKRMENLDLLVKAKQLIIAGDTEAADFYLNKVEATNRSIRFIKARYKALVAFIDEDYEKSLKLLEGVAFNENKYYEKICLLKVINELATNNNANLYNEFDGCLKLTFKYSMNEHYWLTTIFKLKFDREETLKGATLADSHYVLQSKEFVRIWLKSGIYLNKEYLVLKLIKSLPESYYRSKRIRELIGLIYFRTGNKKKAMSFIEDIETPNSENMKGNFHLQQKKYELAFGHYQLALKRKKNSINALERSLPLVWILKQWDQGLKLLERLIKKDLPERKKLTLNTLFKMRQDRYKETQRQLNVLDIMFKEQLPFELDQMMTYVGLRNHDTFQYVKYANKICKAMDGIGCWILMQSITWENIGQTIERDEEVHSAISESIEDMKKTPVINSIDELPTIDQRDIEELDSELIKIDPTETL
ncbi:hypothetical protein A9Q84_12955 [Halobacteriovorax marinus]|uniref:Uncharacterized protein n=1 Tax=Halobacteriovorax marinus TaxID=97084 RepID=A0A1Y5FE29_9BACT|nr:hypothetical protein A9Q84_12955 [Halobacteriovorax marinus]